MGVYKEMTIGSVQGNDNWTCFLGLLTPLCVGLVGNVLRTKLPSILMPPKTLPSGLKQNSFNVNQLGCALKQPNM